MTKRYYFGGWFTTRAYAVVEADEELTKDEIAHYLNEGIYDLEWDHGRKGQITDVELDEIEDDK